MCRESGLNSQSPRRYAIGIFGSLDNCGLHVFAASWQHHFSIQIIVKSFGCIFIRLASPVRSLLLLLGVVVKVYISIRFREYILKFLQWSPILDLAEAWSSSESFHIVLQVFVSPRL